MELVHPFGSQPIRIAIMIDSSYVHCGVQSSPLKWRSNGCVSAQAPITNVNLWIELMQLVDEAVPTWFGSKSRGALTS